MSLVGMAMDRDRDRVKLLSNRIERSELKPGDHIYTWRFAYTYAHHGIYIGDNKVVHFTSRPEDCKACAVAKCQHQAPATDGSAASAERGVRISCLDCFVHKLEHLYLYAYGVSTMFFVSKSVGTCTMAHSDPPDRVLHRALYLLKHDGYGKYDLISHNCEDFSIYCKTELVIPSYNFTGLSNQVQGRIARATVEMEGGPLIKFLGSELGRYRSDFGVRKDVAKVPVEKLVKGASDITGQTRQGVLKCLNF